MNFRFSYNPFRRTSPQGKQDAPRQELQSAVPNYDDMIANIDRVMGKWRSHISLLDQKFGAWELNPDNTDIPQSIRTLLLPSPDSRGGSVLSYKFYKSMVRRSLALWDVDPSEVAALQTGDPEADDQAYKGLVARAIVRTGGG